MTGNIRQQLAERYLGDYIKEVKQGSGFWPKMGRLANHKARYAVSLSMFGVQLGSLALVGFAAIPAALALTTLGASLAVSTTLLVPCSLAARKMFQSAIKKMNEDIDNGSLLKRYLADEAAEAQLKDPAQAPILLEFKQGQSCEEYFQQVAVKPSKPDMAPVEQPAATPNPNKKPHFYK